MRMAIYYGSSTGNTESAAEAIKEQLDELIEEVVDIADGDIADLANYDVIFLGSSTWNIGELQDDWADFLPEFDNIDLTGKKIALFAMGDQEGYPYNFLDSMGEVYDKVTERGATCVGKWPTEGYEFDESRANKEDGFFVGLGLDEDNQADETAGRIEAWLEQVVTELGLL